MQNNLADLNNHLFATLENLQNDELSDEQLEKELKRAKGMCSVSSQILKVASLQITAIKTAESCGLLNRDMPALLAVKDSEVESAATESAKRKLLEAVK